MKRSRLFAVLLGIGLAVGLLVDVLPSSAARSSAGASSVPTSIPVLTWHELNNGCASTVAVCDAADPESVSTAQLTAELAYLKAQKYHTVTAAQYVAWAEGSKAALPANPILLIADNGIENFLAGAEPILASDGFQLSVAVITGFADGASGTCPEPTFESGCPAANEDGGWDATWAQLAALPSSVYNFILEAGAAGHFVQTYDPNCQAFYACTLPSETPAAYETRVEADVTAGTAEAISELGASRFNTGAWVVPYSDDGYTACTTLGCTPQPYDGPAGWLTSWTASTFPVAFVEDAFRNGEQHERFRIDVQGWMTESDFETALSADTAAGDFTLQSTALPTPVTPPTPPTVSTAPVASIPVLSLDSTTMSTGQLSSILAYLHSAGDNTISAANYVSWTEGATVALPPSPILITVTGGNASYLAAITPTLQQFGFNAVDFVSSQTADSTRGGGTWAQLGSLNSSVWAFSFSSGSAGGTRVAADPTKCNVYYACEARGETATAYETRVSNEIGTGRLELDNQLWMQTVDDDLWSPPFGDVGLAGQEYNGPSGWLPQWASWVFPVVFVPGGASGLNEHNVLVVTGSTTESKFESTLTSDMAAGAFSN